MTVAPPLAGAIHDVFFLIAAVVSLSLWLTPTIVAFSRRARRLPLVIALNVLLAWTIIGWIVALVLAFGPRRSD
jgi:hypothetical protein